MPERPSCDHGSATNPATVTAPPAETFGFPATVTEITSPPDSSRAMTCTSHNGKPVALSTRGWPVSKLTRRSGARVQVNDTPVVLICSFIDLSFLVVIAPGRALPSVQRDKLDIAMDMCGHFGQRPDISDSGWDRVVRAPVFCELTAWRRTRLTRGGLAASTGRSGANS